MKILILSDSHSSLHFMREAIRYFSPNAVIHLGDYYDDGTTMAEEFPDVRFYQVPGNCDKYRNIMGAPEILVCKVCGVKLYLTHGHCHYVKSGLWSLLKDARRAGVQGVLFGHTHATYCTQEPDGLWVVNPGSCGYGGRTAALMEVADGKISGCHIIGQPDLV